MSLVVMVTASFLVPVLSSSGSADTLTARERRIARIAKPYVKIDGVKEPIKEGDVIQKGVRVGENCYYDKDNTVGFSLPDDMGAVAYHVVLGQDADCDLIVEEAAPMEPPKDEPGTEEVARRGLVEHRMWAYHTVEDPFNFTMNEERVKLTYDRNGSFVVNGRDKFRHSYIATAQWNTDHQAQNSDLNGPNEVFYYSRTRYWSPVPPTPDYALSSRATADPGNRASCSFSQGNLPFGWGRECSGGLFY